MNIENVGDFGNKFLVTIPSVGHLSLVNVCHCLIDNFKDEFMSAISDTGLDFSDQVSSIVTVSRISHVASDNSQSRILLQILRYKLGVTLFELEYKMKDLCEERISPQFDEYSYIHKKEPTILIDSFKLNVNNINRVNSVVRGDCDQEGNVRNSLHSIDSSIDQKFMLIFDFGVFEGGKQLLELKESIRNHITTINENNDNQISREEIIENLTFKREFISNKINRIRKHKNKNEGIQNEKE